MIELIITVACLALVVGYFLCAAWNCIRKERAEYRKYDGSIQRMAPMVKRPGARPARGRS